MFWGVFFSRLKIIHLKRFQFMNGRWVKSNKVVNFTMNHFDPSEFVVKRSTPSDYDLTEECSSIRTVNVKTVDEEGKNEVCCSEVVLETASDKVSLKWTRRQQR